MLRHMFTGCVRKRMQSVGRRCIAQGQAARFTPYNERLVVYGLVEGVRCKYNAC